MTDRPHRIRGSLDRHVGRSATDNETLHELAATAFRQRRAVVFLAAHLDAMPTMVRALIEGATLEYYKLVFGQVVEGATGARLEWPTAERPAPEHEKAGRA